MTALSDELASFVTDLSVSDLPSESRSLVERCVLDTIGVALAGSVDGAGAIAFDVAAATAARPSGSILYGTATSVSPTEAAFANATAGHTLDFDDYTMAIPSHSSVTMVPAMLAVAPLRSMDGTDLGVAYVAGFETQYYLGSMVKPAHYGAGWHATSTFGTFGATAAACSVLDLSEAETRVALNTAASMAAGVRQNFGSMVKPMHAGIASRAGVKSALYAAEGSTAAPDAISGEHGFLELYSGDDPPDRSARPTLGEYWAIVEDGLIFKKYAACGAIHTAAAAAETLRARHGLVPEEINSITVRGSRRLPEILRFTSPETPEQAKFAIDYPVSSVLVRGSAGLDEFEPEAVQDSRVQALCDCVTFEVDDSLAYNAAEATVQVETADGRTLQETQRVRPGSPVDPLTDTELRRKFESCAGRVLDAGTVDRLYDALRPLEEIDIEEILDYLTTE